MIFFYILNGLGTFCFFLLLYSVPILITSANSDHVPSELIDISASHVWEVQLQSFLSNVIQPAGFELVRWTRLPYLCEGDFTQSFYYLNDIVMVLRVADP